MTPTTGRARLAPMLVLWVAMLAACGPGRGADGQGATADAREPGRSEAGGQAAASEQGPPQRGLPVSQSDERRRQDSVLRAPADRQRRKPGSDSPASDSI